MALATSEATAARRVQAEGNVWQSMVVGKDASVHNDSLPHVKEVDGLSLPGRCFAKHTLANDDALDGVSLTEIGACFGTLRSPASRSQNKLKKRGIDRDTTSYGEIRNALGIPVSHAMLKVASSAPLLEAQGAERPRTPPVRVVLRRRGDVSR